MISDTFLDALQNQVVQPNMTNDAVYHPTMSDVEINANSIARRTNGPNEIFHSRFVIGGVNMIPNPVESIPEIDEQEEEFFEQVRSVTSSFYRVGLPTIIEEPEEIDDNNVNDRNENEDNSLPKETQPNDNETNKNEDSSVIEEDQENANNESKD